MPSYNKLYKEIFSESKMLNDNGNNSNTDRNNEIKANPLKKTLTIKKDNKKISRAKTVKKRNTEKMLFVNNLVSDIDEQVKTDNSFTNEPKDENQDKKHKRRKSKKFSSQKNTETYKNKIKEKESDEKKEEVNLNELPYTKAIELDKRNILFMYYSFLVEKLEFINIFCISSKFKLIHFIEYILSLLITFFLNALLYSDDIVSHKYHNNGKLDFAVSLALSIISNVVTSLLCHYLNYTRGLDERIDLILEVKNNMHYFKNIKKFYIYLKRKFICFCISQAIAFAVCIYYIEIFCVKYYCSQMSLLANFGYSFTETIITSFVITFLIIFTRKIGLVCRSKELYNTSKYINNKS